jgi:hypothetical protein
MEEKNIWMYLFFAMLLVCAVLAVLLAYNKGVNSRTQADKNELNHKAQCDDLKARYDELKKSYLGVAHTQSDILSTMMLKHDELRANNPGYKDLKDNAELDKRVRKDLGLLEVKIEALEKEK